MKKNLWLLLACMALCLVACGEESRVLESFGYEGSYETFVDERDGRTYKMVSVGDQVWMAENLKYKSPLSSCYKNDLQNCEKDGRLYEEEELDDVCPEGWHVPGVDEWKELYDFADQKTTNLFSTSGWDDHLNHDTYGMSIEPVGYKVQGNFYEQNLALFWGYSKTGISYEKVEFAAYGMSAYAIYVSASYSVRCVKGTVVRSSSSSAEPEPQGTSSSSSLKWYDGDLGKTVSFGIFNDERDGQSYTTILVDGTLWMAANLKYAEGRDYCPSDQNVCKNTRLYDWESAVIACPEGWHLPDTTEWNALHMFMVNLYGEVDDYYEMSAFVDAAGLKFAYIEGRPSGWSSAAGNNYFWSATSADSLMSYMVTQAGTSVNFKQEKKTSSASVHCVSD